jgi:uncharacterized repeat protein (TIGR03847 family)
VPRHVHFFDPPERFVAGTVGAPGERAFYLQAREGPRVTSVLLEKEQVAELASQVDDLLDRLSVASGGETVPADLTDDVTDTEPLEMPLTEEFRVGAIALGWDRDAECVVIEAHAMTEDGSLPPGIGEEGSDEGPDALVVRMPGQMARAFAARATAVVGAGRPACPLCGLPLDPDGHICPRHNGKLR